MRLDGYFRLITKDAIDDIAFLEDGLTVKTIFDVGANIGFVTFQFKKRFPEADIYAFEPNPYVFEELKKSYDSDFQVHPNMMGVGDVNGELEFNVNFNTGTSSFLEAGAYHRANQARRIKERHLTKVVTLDDFCLSQNIQHVDILKMDIEGYELKALQGSKELLSRQAVGIIYTEVTLVSSYVGQPLFHEITEFLLKHDYHLYNIDSFIGQETKIRQAIVGNATYISSNFRKIVEEKFGKENCGW